MSFDLYDRSSDGALPTDITNRVGAYRGPGVLARLNALLVTLVMNARLRQIARRRYRRRMNAPPVPDYLRRDLGLPPVDPRPPSPYEVRW